jgi:hypothetical protein
MPKADLPNRRNPLLGLILKVQATVAVTAGRPYRLQIHSKNAFPTSIRATTCNDSNQSRAIDQLRLA